MGVSQSAARSPITIAYLSAVLVIFTICFIKSCQKLSFQTHMLEILYGSIIGYYYGGLWTGIIHWFLDSYNFKFLSEPHKHFRTHHNNPMSLEKFSNFVHLTEAIPVVFTVFVVPYFINNPLVIVLHLSGMLVTSSAQLIHKYCHRRNHENDKDPNGNYIYQRVPKWIKILQNTGFILNPTAHSKHHRTELTNYCIVHSNADRLFEYIFIEVFR
eukprot:129838_1